MGLEEKDCGVPAWRRRVCLGGRDRRWKHYNFIQAVDILWGGAWIGGVRRGHTYIYTYTELPWNSVKGCENSGREIAIQRCINKTAVPGWFCEDEVVQVTTGRDGCCVRAPAVFIQRQAKTHVLADLRRRRRCLGVNDPARLPRRHPASSCSSQTANSLDEQRVFDPQRTSIITSQTSRTDYLYTSSHGRRKPTASSAGPVHSPLPHRHLPVY